MAIAATLVLGTFVLGNTAFAVEPGDQFKIKTKKGLATCTIPGEESCGEGKAKAQFRLLAINVEEGSASGDAQGQISLDFNRTKGMACILPDIDEQRCIQKMVNNGPLSFVFYPERNILEITGNVIDQNDNIYDFVAKGEVGEFKNGKAAIDFSIQMILIDAPSAGLLIEIPVLGGVVLVPISG